MNENDHMLTNKVEEKNIFLGGKTVSLRAPDIEKDVIQGEWHSWFNNIDNTKYLTHGVFPVTRDQQADYVKAAIESSSTMLLCIVQKQTDRHIGVISLKAIDLTNRMAEIGIVMSPLKLSGGEAIEAMALLIRHAFSRLNLESLHAGQHEALWKWVNSLSMLGFRIDGFREHGGYRDCRRHGTFHTSVSATDFFALEAGRGGDILNPTPLDVLRRRPKFNPAIALRQSLLDMNLASQPAGTGTRTGI